MVDEAGETMGDFFGGPGAALLVESKDPVGGGKLTAAVKTLGVVCGCGERIVVGWGRGAVPGPMCRDTIQAVSGRSLK